MSSVFLVQTSGDISTKIQRKEPGKKHNSNHQEEVSDLDYKQVIPVIHTLPKQLWYVLWCFKNYFSWSYVFSVFCFSHIWVILDIIFLYLLMF